VNDAASCHERVPPTVNCGAFVENCCLSLDVQGGTFARTYDAVDFDSGVLIAPDGGLLTGAYDPATVTGFRLDKYAVTVGRFRQYVNYLTACSGVPPADGSGKHDHLNGGKGLVDANTVGGAPYETGWNAAAWDPLFATGPGAAALWNANLTSCRLATWTAQPSTHDLLPINCLTWYEAYAFCIWDGGFLPSEAEWEYAAAGGNQQRQFPWGSTPPNGQNQYAIYSCDYPQSQASTCSGLSNIAPVGAATLGAGFWGQLDLAGNVGQWTLDWYTVYATPCVDCANLTEVLTLPTSRGSGSYRVYRGGAFNLGPPGYLVPPSRSFAGPAERWDSVGVRCARTP
jgi:formylglycine-generating enzyme required for sulfatase activity